MCSMATTRLRMLATANLLIETAVAEIEECVALGGGLYEALPSILANLREAGLYTAVPIRPATALELKRANKAAQARAATIAASEARRNAAHERGELALEFA